jgi:hypothetical protein
VFVYELWKQVENEPLVSFSDLFRSECKLILFSTDNVYHAISKVQKTNAKFDWKGQKQCLFESFSRKSSDRSALYRCDTCRSTYIDRVPKILARRIKLTFIVTLVERELATFWSTWVTLRPLTWFYVEFVRSFLAVFCRLLFVLLPFIHLVALYCLSFFDYGFWLSIWYLQTFFINFGYTYCTIHITIARWINTLNTCKSNNYFLHLDFI